MECPVNNKTNELNYFFLSFSLNETNSDNLQMLEASRLYRNIY